MGRFTVSARVAAREVVGLVVGSVLTCSLAACGVQGGSPSAESPGTQPSTTATTPRATPTPTALVPAASPGPARPSAGPSDGPSGRPIAGTYPPPWLGTRVLPLAANGLGQVQTTPQVLVQRRFTLPDQLPMLPGAGFASRVTTPAPGGVIARSTWKQGCPVAAKDLSWVRVTFWGFDRARHTGELLVNRSVAGELVQVFRRLYAARFPIEEMRVTRADELDAPPTGDGNNTGAYSCRPTVGATSYSQHAYGLAIDVNPFQNPYVKADVVLPELASSYLERGWVRPGMILADGPVVRAFDEIGWAWGGTWSSLKDLQHFSQNGR